LALIGFALPRLLIGFALPRLLIGFALPRLLIGFALQLLSELKPAMRMQPKRMLK
jgi:hypothetical protein